MLQVSLNGDWTLHVIDPDNRPVFPGVPARVPGSVYTDLLRAGLIEDPFYRDNELAVLPLMENRSVFERTFVVSETLLACDDVRLCCEGLDTLASLYVNDRPVAQTDNMHRRYEFSVQDCLLPGMNTIRILFDSPTRYIREAWENAPINGSTDAMRGFPYLRKAHCMFGWDWGPRLPDAGIWRDISLTGLEHGIIRSVYVRQEHRDKEVYLNLDIQTAFFSDEADFRLVTTLTGPDGTIVPSLAGATRIHIGHPALWWPNGFGDQPLYTLKVDLYEGDRHLDGWQRRIGLRTLTVRREQDDSGEGFAHEINGISVFAMGADYIPEDSLLGRLSPERTRRLLEDAVAANFNCVRVWGGGHYPADWFYDFCDELGLIVWQDFMFACANYELTPAFRDNIRQECIDNVVRLRHHASLGLWCGNNEMEWFQAEEKYRPTPKQKADYIRMFECLIPDVLADYDPTTFYWPASPSSGGGFDAPNDPDRGDVHYWEVWHGGLPFTAYRDHRFRYVSEFGFQSFPGMKTVKSFTEPQDRNIFSRVMEMHQRNASANGKILHYLSATYLYPKDFEHLLYASQLLQAEAIQYGVEHWRRNRGHCMGSIYWQLNDCWPVASWSGIDSEGRWKALHYYARRFFAPVLLSCAEEGEMTQRRSITEEPHVIEPAATLSVANETRQTIQGTVYWSLRDASGDILQRGEYPIAVDALQSCWLERLVFPSADVTRHYLSYRLDIDGITRSEGSVLLCAPKHFAFDNPGLRWSLDGNTINVSADCYARNIEIDSPDSDLVLSDNYFHLDGDSRKPIQILRGNPKTLTLRSVYDIATRS